MANWQPLQSSNLRRCDYDIETGTFRSSPVREGLPYQGVPASVYTGSWRRLAGQFFNQNIKGVYDDRDPFPRAKSAHQEFCQIQREKYGPTGKPYWPKRWPISLRPS